MDVPTPFRNWTLVRIQRPRARILDGQVGKSSAGAGVLGTPRLLDAGSRIAVVTPWRLTGVVRYWVCRSLRKRERCWQLLMRNTCAALRIDSLGT